MTQTAAFVECFGKLIYEPRDDKYPVLPDLNVLVYKHPENDFYTHSAVCIQLELDVCGNSIEDVKEELMQAIGLYFYAQSRHCNSLDEFAQKIIDNVYSHSDQKNTLFIAYNKAEQDYLKNNAQKNKTKIPNIEPSKMAEFLFGNGMQLSPAAMVM